jgi:O-antigen/teichoic acid export membrane protein
MQESSFLNGHPGDRQTDTGESEAERNNRNLADLLQELRVAGLGVQVLFGFLLSLPFSMRFTTLTPGERDLYRASVLCAALSIGLLVSPVAYHRWVFRRHVKGKLLKIANVEALIGLAMVALAVCTAVWLVLMVVGMSWFVALLASMVTGGFVVLWFVLPIIDRITADSHRDTAQAIHATDGSRTGVPIAHHDHRV